MAKSTKMDNFRTLNLDVESTPPKKKDVLKKRKVNRKENKETSLIDENEYEYENETSKKRGLGITIFFMILIIAGAIVGCLFTPVFQIVNVEVQEGEYVTNDEVMSKLDDVNGQNIFRVNISELEKSIRQMPYIRSVDIKRRLPDTLEVCFEERKPYAIIKYLESFVVMDKYGYVLEIKKENDLPDLAIVYGINADEFVAGEKLGDVAGLKYENITYLIETSYKNDFDYTIYEINYEDTERLVMAVKGLDVDINFGEIDRSILTEKMSYLNGTLKNLNGKKGNLDISSNNYLEKTIFRERF